MKSLLFPVLFISMLFMGCGDDEDLTGSIDITFENISFTDEPDFEIRPSIFLDDEDEVPLIDLFDLPLNTIPYTYEVEELLPGNYYLKYQFAIPSQNSLSSLRTRPFQIIAGKEKEMKIEL